MPTKPIDLDSELELDGEPGPQHVKTVRLLGLDLRVVCDLNSFGLAGLAAEDSGAIMRYMRSMIHADDWPRFVEVASQHQALRGDKGNETIIKIINRLTEVAAERPTKQPSDLPRGGSTRSSGQKSAASTASARAKASTRSR